MLKGRVIRVVEEKGFGFISVEGNKKDYFFHMSSFTGHWDDLCKDVGNNEEVLVNFEERNTPKGMRAENVRRLDYPNEG